jgi:mono/diheme cytochrome c family protein
MRKTRLWWWLGALVILGMAIQLVPYGHARTNPPVRREPAWDRPATRDLAVRACYDCHSNQTVWPWYARIAPVSWLIQGDVDDGRRKLNFSEWDRSQREAHEAVRRVQRGSMPPWYYVLMHSKANLSAVERQALIQGLGATLAQDRPPRLGKWPNALRRIFSSAGGSGRLARAGWRAPS